MSRDADRVSRLSKELYRVVDVSADFLKAIGPHMLHIGLYAIGFVKKVKAKKKDQQPKKGDKKES